MLETNQYNNEKSISNLFITGIIPESLLEDMRNREKSFKSWPNNPKQDLKVKKLYPDAQLPTRERNSDAAYDLYCYETVHIDGQSRGIVKTGISLQPPRNYYGQISDRSGVAAKKGLTKMAGVIDSTYSGEILIVLFNTNKEGYYVQKGDKIAQIVFLEYGDFDIIEVESLNETERANKGFGSSDKT